MKKIKNIKDLKEIIKTKDYSEFLFVNNNTKTEIIVKVEYLDEYNVYKTNIDDWLYSNKWDLIETIIDYMYSNGFIPESKNSVNINIKEIEKQKQKNYNEAINRVKEIENLILKKTGLDLSQIKYEAYMRIDDGWIAYDSSKKIIIRENDNVLWRIENKFGRYQDMNFRDDNYFRTYFLKNNDDSDLINLRKESIMKLLLEILDNYGNQEINRIIPKKTKMYMKWCDWYNIDYEYIIRMLFWLYKSKELKNYVTYYSYFH